MSCVGRTFRVKETIKSLCCSHDLEAGEVVQVYSHPSPNRLVVCLVEGEWVNTCHKVKRSTLNRCSDEIKKGGKDGR